MNAIPPLVSPNENFESINTTSIKLSNLYIGDIVELVSIDFSDVETNSRQAIINVTGSSLSTGSFKNVFVTNENVSQNSVIIVSLLQHPIYSACIANPIYIQDGSFSITITNLGSAMITDEFFRIFYTIIN